MAAKLKQVLSLYRLYARMDAAWFLQDTRNCLLVMAGELVSNLAAISGILLLAVRFGGVGGLTQDEMLFLLGFTTLGDGVINLLFMNFNTGHISRRVGRGQVDHMLIMPIPLWMQLLTEGFIPVSGAGIFLSGLVVTALAVARLGLALTPGWFLLLALFLICRAALQLGLSYLVGASAFYHPAACEEISSVVLDMTGELTRYPLAGLTPLMQALLYTLLPVGCMAYLPALVLLSKTDWPLSAAWPAITAAVAVSAATLAFRKGLKHYAKVGSSRYRGMGHRS